MIIIITLLYCNFNFTAILLLFDELKLFLLFLVLAVILTLLSLITLIKFPEYSFYRVYLYLHNSKYFLPLHYVRSRVEDMIPVTASHNIVV